MLAGLIRDDERTTLDGIPGLVDLPIVGHLFGHNTKTVNQSDIILTLTPHIIRVLDLSEADLRPFRVGRDSLAPISELPVLPREPANCGCSHPNRPGRRNRRGLRSRRSPKTRTRRQIRSLRRNPAALAVDRSPHVERYQAALALPIARCALIPRMFETSRFFRVCNVEDEPQGGNLVARMIVRVSQLW